MGIDDDPVLSQEKDRLNRWPLAQQISLHVPEKFDERCTRLGICAPWGEGKTSVVNFVERQLSDQNHLVVRLEVWACNSSFEVWLRCAALLLKVGDELNIDISKYLPKQIVGKLKKLTDEKEVPKLAFSFLGGSEFINKSFETVESFLYRLLCPNEDLADRLKEKTNDKKIVIIVDDLDRMKSSLLPRFLMTIREVLNASPFTFIVWYDKSVLIRNLDRSNEPWTTGESFLDKIIDLQFGFPPLVSAVKKSFCQDLLSQQCSFIPPADRVSLSELCPESPRLIKGWIRQISSLSTVADRHRLEELSWRTIGALVLLEMTSFDFFNLVYSKVTNDELSASKYRDFTLQSKEAGGIKQEWYGLLDDHPLGSSRKSKIRRIVDYIIQNGSYLYPIQFQYQFDALKTPHCFTWQEYDEYLSDQSNDPSRESIESWLRGHRSRRQLSAQAIVYEFVTTSIASWAEHLERARDAYGDSEHSRLIVRARRSFESALICTFEGVLDVDARVLRDIDLAVKIYKTMMLWHKFRNNSADSDLRDAEMQYFVRVIDEWEINPVDFASQTLFDNFFVDETNEYASDILQPLLRRLKTEAINQFKIKNGIQRLLDDSIDRPLQLVLLDPKYGLWDDDYASELAFIADSAATETVHNENVRSFLLLANSGLKGQTNVRRESVQELLANPVFIRMWSAFTATEMQYLAHLRVVKLRDDFVGMGARAEDFQLPGWIHPDFLNGALGS